MNMRMTQRSVTFRNSFTLSGVGKECRPGTYLVETDQLTLDSVALLAYRRVATRIYVETPGNTQVFSIDPEELDRVIEADARGTAPGGRQ